MMLLKKVGGAQLKRVLPVLNSWVSRIHRFSFEKCENRIMSTPPLSIIVLYSYLISFQLNYCAIFVILFQISQRHTPRIALKRASGGWLFWSQ